MGFERAFLDALDTVTTVEPRGDNRFAMLNAQGEAIMVWQSVTPDAPADAPLEGTEWVLTTVINDDAATSLIAGTSITMLLEDGTISGSAGCNTYNSSYTLEGNTLTIAPEIATTRMACADDIMSQEAAFLEVLGEVTGYEREGRTLTFTTDDGRALIFEAS